MIYPGDLVPVVVSLQSSDGRPVQIDATPLVSIVRVETGQLVVSAAPAAPSAGSPEVFVYLWNTAGAEEGWYQAFATYAVNGEARVGRLVGLWQLGDSRIRGVVAREAVVAKEATAARADMVLSRQQFEDAFRFPAGLGGTPGQLMASIWSKVERLPYNPASSDEVSSVRQKVDQLHAHAFGRWELNRTTGELSLFGPDSAAPLARFRLLQNGELTVKEPV